jgi:TonB family protein
VDPPRRVVRNSWVNPRTAEPAHPAPTAAAEGVMVDIVVLSDDVALYQATRDAVGERNPVWRARTAAESVDLLLTGRCGVLLLDMGAVSTQPASLVEQIIDQFPDVVVVVAGRRDDETLLAQLVSDGHVYRFMHKPLSPKRAGMFLQAAIRAHVDRRASHGNALRLPRVGTLRSRFDPRKWLFVGGGLGLFVAVLAAVLVARHDSTTARPSAPRAARPAEAPASGPLADPVLSGARAARAAGRHEAPAGRNALDLYAAVLLARPDNAEAQAGLAATAALLVERANVAAASGDAIEARRLVERVLAVSPDHSGARVLLARLEAPRVAEPAKSASAPTAVSAPITAPDSAPPRFAAPDAAAPRAAGLPATAPARPAQAAPVPRTARVMPDPLTPRSVVPPPAARPAARSGRTRSYGAPISSGHAVAGFAVADPAQSTAQASAPTPAPTPISPLGLADSGTEPGVTTRDLEALATPEPVYPPEAFRAGIEGWVEVEFTVNERGTTGDIVVVAAEPLGVFDAAATAAVAAWRYRPRIVNGQPVAQRTSVTLRFSVED